MSKKVAESPSRPHRDQLARECAGKSRYATEKIANRVRHDCEMKRGVRLRVYPCFQCGGYHLTKLTT